MKSGGKTKVEKSVTSVEEIFRKYRNPRLRIEQLNLLSEHLQSTKPLEAAHIALKAVAIAHDKGYKVLEANSLRRAGLCYYYAGSFRESLENYSRALQIYEDTDEAEGTASVLQNMGLVLRRLERHNEALESYQKSADLFAKTKNVTARQYVLINIATLAAYLFDPVKVFSTYSECLHLLETHDDDFIRAVVTGNLGRFFIDLGDYDKGADFTAKSAELHEKRGDYIGIAHARGSMAFIEKHRGNYNRALELFDESIHAYKKANHQSGFAAALSNAADIALSEKQFELAEKYATESLTEYISIGDIENEARLLCFLGKLQSEKNIKDESIKLLTTAIEKLGTSVNFGLITKVYLGYGSVCEQFEDYEKAIELYTKSLDISEKNHIDAYSFQCAEKLSIVYEKIGDFFNALRYSRLFHEKKSTFDITINSRENQELRYRLEIEKVGREREIMRLRNENLQSQLQSQVSELNTTAMALAQKNDVLGTVVNSLKKVADLKNSERTKALNTVISDISVHIRSDKNRKHLTEKLQDQQREFIDRLAKKASNLSSRETQICSMIRLNLSSKEIADLLCITEKSVEIYRHRIRTKLSLSVGVNLTSYLSSL